MQPTIPEKLMIGRRIPVMALLRLRACCCSVQQQEQQEQQRAADCGLMAGGAVLAAAARPRLQRLCVLLVVVVARKNCGGRTVEKQRRCPTSLCVKTRTHSTTFIIPQLFAKWFATETHCWARWSATAEAVAARSRRGPPSSFDAPFHAFPPTSTTGRRLTRGMIESSPCDRLC